MLPENNFGAVLSMQDPREEFGPPGGDDDGGSAGNNNTTKEDNSDLPHLKIGENTLDHLTNATIKTEPEDQVEIRPVWEEGIKYPTAKVEDCNEDFPPATPGYSTPNCSAWPSAMQVTDQPPITTPVSPLKRKSSRGRKRGQWKLRFHHQALPPEYLDHYEASQNAAASKSVERKLEIPVKPELTSIPSITEATGESVRNWLQRMTAMQQDSNAAAAAAPIMDIDRESPESERKRRPTTRVVNYSDLPYMGEMTLDNSKPRRGRKPKKADICHLIYKNYGTIFPGTPKGLMEDEKKSPRNLRSGSESVATAAQTAAARRTDVQHRIISSLLEKRLTQETRLAQTKVHLQMKAPAPDNEPLNLCVRDLNLRIPPLSPSSSSEDDVQILHDSPISTTPRVTSPETDQMLANNLKMALPQFDSSLLMQKKTGSPDTASSTGSDATAGAGSYVYWPGANVFMHPMALYYHKIAAAAASASGQSSPTSPTLSQSPLIPSSREHQRVLIPKQMSQLIDPEKQIENTATPLSNTRVAATPPVKRKRSAIFIPPMPTENNTNPATEVSICKFKFTGGAKPSLQEKKMLSVDSGGNFRYYSGTGDKSMRGYEFFPRESLQQQAGKTGSSNSGLFLNASGEKVCTNNIENPGQTTNIIPAIPLTAPVATNHLQSRQNDSSRRKRKSRRSLQREKLEQTFKEKGFLIQTQQLESAEGATYCELQGMPVNPEIESGNPDMPSSNLIPVPQDGALSSSPTTL